MGFRLHSLQGRLWGRWSALSYSHRKDKWEVWGGEWPTILYSGFHFGQLKEIPNNSHGNPGESFRRSGRTLGINPPFPQEAWVRVEGSGNGHRSILRGSRGRGQEGDRLAESPFIIHQGPLPTLALHKHNTTAKGTTTFHKGSLTIIECGPRAEAPIPHLHFLHFALHKHNTTSEGLYYFSVHRATRQ